MFVISRGIETLLDFEELPYEEPTINSINKLLKKMNNKFDNKYKGYLYLSNPKSSIRFYRFGRNYTFSHINGFNWDNHVEQDGLMFNAKEEDLNRWENSQVLGFYYIRAFNCKVMNLFETIWCESDIWIILSSANELFFRGDVREDLRGRRIKAYNELSNKMIRIGVNISHHKIDKYSLIYSAISEKGSKINKLYFDSFKIQKKEHFQRIYQTRKR